MMTSFSIGEYLPETTTLAKPRAWTPSRPGDTLQLLIPIDESDASRWGVQYALSRLRAGRKVNVTLLHVAEHITQWQVLRFLSQQKVDEWQLDLAHSYVAAASQPLIAAGMPFRCAFKQGAVVFSILDAAEEFGCHEIVLPHIARSWILRKIAPNSVDKALRQQRSVPIVQVTNSGSLVT